MTVNLEFAVIGDEQCELNHTALSGLSWEFTNNWKRIHALDLEFTASSRDDLSSNSAITIVFEAQSLSQSALDQFERKCNKKRFRPKLQKYLTANQESDGADGGCFEFLTESNSDGTAPSEAWSVWELFDFANYGTTEYLVVTLAALVCCICGALGCCIAAKRRAANKMKQQLVALQSVSRTTNGVEDEMFQRALFGANHGTGSTLRPPINHETVPSDDEGIDL